MLDQGYTNIDSTSCVCCESYFLPVVNCIQRLNACYFMCFGIPGNTRRLPNVVLLLRQRHRRWTTIKTALGQCPLFAGMVRVVLGQYNPALSCIFGNLVLQHHSCRPISGLLLSLYLDLSKLEFFLDQDLYYHNVYSHYQHSKWIIYDTSLTHK